MVTPKLTTFSQIHTEIKTAQLNWLSKSLQETKGKEKKKKKTNQNNDLYSTNSLKKAKQMGKGKRNAERKISSNSKISPYRSGFWKLK